MKAGVVNVGAVNVGLQVAEARKKRSTDDACIISLPQSKGSVKSFKNFNFLTYKFQQILILKKMTD